MLAQIKFLSNTARLFMIVGVMFRMMLGRLLGMVRGLQVMTLRQVSVMAGAFVLTGLVMIGSLMMVIRGLLVMLRCFAVVFRALMLGHWFSPCLFGPTIYHWGRDVFCDSFRNLP
jgi:hypothetical protein